MKVTKNGCASLWPSYPVGMLENNYIDDKHCCHSEPSVKCQKDTYPKVLKSSVLSSKSCMISSQTSLAEHVSKLQSQHTCCPPLRSVNLCKFNIVSKCHAVNPDHFVKLYNFNVISQ